MPLSARRGIKQARRLLRKAEAKDGREAVPVVHRG